ncbi:NAD(P)H-binding protein [Cupriavidus sp. 2TAF22]|uniref:NAD(P)H-binding protein n=1 Tax=unclassified Cupriavidus TaxID=2640874 RepID=UPI003F8DB0E1
MSKTVLILGANGRLGRTLVDAFAGAGWQVLAQARRPLAGPVPPAVRALDLDVTQTARLAAAAHGASVVINALNPAYTEWARHAAALARAAEEVALALDALLMFPGNVYNFGESMPPLLRPDTAQRPTARKSKIRHDIEAAMRERTPALRSVVIRAGDYFGGPGRGSWMDLAIARSLGQGKVVYPGPRDRAHAWAYLPDLAQAFVAVATRHATLRGHTVLHFAGHTLTGDELVAALGDAGGLRQPPRVGGMPWWLIRAGAALVPMWRELAEMAYLWKVPHAMDGSALDALVGALPRTPLGQALRTSLDQLGLCAAA